MKRPFVCPADGRERKSPAEPVSRPPPKKCDEPVTALRTRRRTDRPDPAGRCLTNLGGGHRGECRAGGRSLRRYGDLAASAVAGGQCSGPQRCRGHRQWRAPTAVLPDSHAAARRIECTAGGTGHAAAHRSLTMRNRCPVVTVAALDAHGAPAQGGGARMDSPRARVNRIVKGRPQ